MKRFFFLILDFIYICNKSNVSILLQTQRYQTLVALMLSSQTKDEVTYSAMSRLKEQGLTAKAISRMSLPELENIIYPVSFYKVLMNSIFKFQLSYLLWFYMYIVFRIRPNIYIRPPKSSWRSMMATSPIMSRILQLCPVLVQRWPTYVWQQPGIWSPVLGWICMYIESPIDQVWWNHPLKKPNKHVWPLKSGCLENYGQRLTNYLWALARQSVTPSIRSAMNV